MPSALSYIPPALLHTLRYAKHYLHFLPYRKESMAIEKYKNRHAGKRCFILGSGPSMKTTDLGPLAGEHVIALNSFFLHPQLNEVLKGTEKEKYYLIPPNHPPQTEAEWKETLEKMEANMQYKVPMFWGLDFNEGHWKHIIEKYGLFKGFDLQYFFCGINIREGYEFNPRHMDITHMTLAAGNPLIHALSLAFLMGFTEIYLMGFEHNSMFVQTSEDYRFYADAPHQKTEAEIDFGKLRTNDANYIALDFYYHQFKLYLGIYHAFQEKHRIVNLTPNSMIDVFPKMRYEDVIATTRKA